MNAMIVPMIQHDLATTKDLKDVKSYMDDGFEKTNEHIDNLENITEKGFAAVRSEMNHRFDEAKAYVDDGFEKTNEHIDNLEIGMNHRFDILEKDVKLILETVQKK